MEINVRNIRNYKGNIVKNQFIITQGTTNYFQSYSTLICKFMAGSGVLVTFGNPLGYSTTTSRHFYNFLEESGINRPDSKTWQKWEKMGYIPMDANIYHTDITIQNVE